MKPTADPTTIVLIDDNDLLRAGLKEILETYQDLRVVGEAGDSVGAMAVIAEKRPEVVLLDVQIPGDDVATTVHRIHDVSPAAKVIIVSLYASETLVRRLVGIGVYACLSKSVGHEELVSTIRRARARPSDASGGIEE